MAGAAVKPGKTARQTALHLGGVFPDAWQEVLQPWFEAVARATLTSPEPIAVITPSPNHSAFLRSQLLARDISLLGVKFLSPVRLRHLLLRETALTIPSLEDRRLLLSIAA